MGLCGGSHRKDGYSSLSIRDLTLDLGFLGEGNWKMEIFQDGVNANRCGADFKHHSSSLGEKRSIDISMAAGGGWVAVLSK